MPAAAPPPAAGPAPLAPAASSAAPAADLLSLPPAPDRVRRRRVAFLCGFDPQGPAHYHQLYRDQAAAAAVLGGYALEVGPRRKGGELLASWSLTGRFPVPPPAAAADGLAAGAEAADPPDPSGPAAETVQTVHTRFDFLRWDDVVRSHWPRGRAALFATTLRGSWAMWRRGVMLETLRSAWPMFLAIALPAALLLLGALLGLGLLAGAGGLLAAGQGLAALALLGLGGPALWRLAVWAEARSHMAWLMRSLACLDRQACGCTPDLEARLDEQAERLATELRDAEEDEWLIVGHSSGAMMAAIVLARALRRLADAAPPGPAPGPLPALALLTLGHCSPLLGAHPLAVAYRAELARLRATPGLCWVDYAAPPDGCCFALADPSRHAQPLQPGPGAPRLFNPRFAEAFDPPAYAALRRDKFRMHFQYLMAGGRPPAADGYDYFAITAGPLSLAARHAGRPGVRDFRRFQCLGGPRR